MATYWDLRTNRFEEVSSEFVEQQGLEPVKTLDGKVVYIPSAQDDYGINVRKAFDVINRVGLRVCEIIGDGSEWNKEGLENFYKNLDTEHRFYYWLNKNIIISYLKEVMIINNKRKPLVAQCLNNAIVHGVSGTSNRSTNKTYEDYYIGISRNFLKTVFKKCSNTSLDEACGYYNLSASKLEELANLKVTRIYVKAFVKEGAGFVLARILTSNGVIVAREGVDESVGTEFAELELLRRVSTVAKDHGLPVQVVSGQLNVVNWLNKNNQPETHESLRSQILEWLYPLKFTVRQMTEVENKAYREEKRRISA
jgi:hypothetical protein